MTKNFWLVERRINTNSMFNIYQTREDARHFKEGIFAFSNLVGIERIGNPNGNESWNGYMYDLTDKSVDTFSMLIRKMPVKIPSNVDKNDIDKLHALITNYAYNGGTTSILLKLFYSMEEIKKFTGYNHLYTKDELSRLKFGQKVYSTEVIDVVSYTKGEQKWFE